MCLPIYIQLKNCFVVTKRRGYMNFIRKSHSTFTSTWLLSKAAQIFAKYDIINDNGVVNQ